MRDRHAVGIDGKARPDLHCVTGDDRIQPVVRQLRIRPRARDARFQRRYRCTGRRPRNAGCDKTIIRLLDLDVRRCGRTKLGGRRCHAVRDPGITAPCRGGTGSPHHPAAAIRAKTDGNDWFAGWPGGHCDRASLELCRHLNHTHAAYTNRRGFRRRTRATARSHRECAVAGLVNMVADRPWGSRAPTHLRMRPYPIIHGRHEQRRSARAE